MDKEQFDSNLKYEIPALYRNWQGQIVAPTQDNLPWEEDSSDEYDQYSLLDYIEFFAQNCRDVELGSYHSYFGHHHLTCRNSDVVFEQFRDEINDIFQKTGLQYKLTDDKTIERIIEDTPLSPEIEQEISKVKENGTRELLTEAIALFRQPYPQSARDAVEKIWDAFERLKTYYTTLDKKVSITRIINDMAGGNSNNIDLFDTEFEALTTIGNNYRIRHHETNKIDITDPKHYDYFFNRCLSLIALAIQYLQ